MLFSHVKISSFRAKAHLVFHWCLYNKNDDDNEFDYNDDYSDEDGDDDNKYSDSEGNLLINKIVYSFNFAFPGRSKYPEEISTTSARVYYTSYVSSTHAGMNVVRPGIL